MVALTTQVAIACVTKQPALGLVGREQFLHSYVCRVKLDRTETRAISAVAAVVKDEPSLGLRALHGCEGSVGDGSRTAAERLWLTAA